MFSSVALRAARIRFSTFILDITNCVFDSIRREISQMRKTN